MEFRFEIGVAKVGKHASRESGDTLEVVERPAGGVSLVLIDGQGSGLAAKALSTLLAGKAISMINEGVRDGAVARAMNDILLTLRGGQVSASADILSIDVKRNSIVLTRNGSTPYVLVRDDQVDIVGPDQGAIGHYSFARPSISTFAFESCLQVWLVSDGITGAGGKRLASDFPLKETIQEVRNRGLPPTTAARFVLDRAREMDDGRPGDDMTVATLYVLENTDGSRVRELWLSTTSQ